MAKTALTKMTIVMDLPYHVQRGGAGGKRAWQGHASCSITRHDLGKRARNDGNYLWSYLHRVVVASDHWACVHGVGYSRRRQDTVNIQ